MDINRKYPTGKNKKENRKIHTDFQGNPDFFSGKTDSEIWELFKSGHEGAFLYIYETYLDDLFRYGSRITENREIIKDAIHDLFVDLRRSSNLSNTKSIKFYLLKALRWKILRLVKIRHKNFNTPYSDVQFRVELEISCEEKMINIQVSREQLKKLDKGIKGLTKRQIEALYHFYYEDMNYNQVAEIMKLSNIKSARNLIYKSIDRLKKYFKEN